MNNWTTVLNERSTKNEGTTHNYYAMVTIDATSREYMTKSVLICWWRPYIASISVGDEGMRSLAKVQG